MSDELRCYDCNTPLHGYEGQVVECPNCKKKWKLERSMGTIVLRKIPCDCYKTPMDDTSTWELVGVCEPWICGNPVTPSVEVRIPVVYRCKKCGEKAYKDKYEKLMEVVGGRVKVKSKFRDVFIKECGKLGIPPEEYKKFL